MQSAGEHPVGNETTSEYVPRVRMTHRNAVRSELCGLPGNASLCYITEGGRADVDETVIGNGPVRVAVAVRGAC